MQRPVEQRERGALARAVEGSPCRDFLTSFDVRRRERAKRTRQFRDLKIGEVTAFERSEPGVEGGGFAQDARRSWSAKACSANA